MLAAPPAWADPPPEPPEGHQHLVLWPGECAKETLLCADEAMWKYDVERLRWTEEYARQAKERAESVPLEPLIGAGVGFLVGGIVALLVKK